MSSSTVYHHRARVAALTRSRASDDADLVAERRALAEASISEYVRKVVAAAPPLTGEQRDRLALLLRDAS